MMRLGTRDLTVSNPSPASRHLAVSRLYRGNEPTLAPSRLLVHDGAAGLSSRSPRRPFRANVRVADDPLGAINGKGVFAAI